MDVSSVCVYACLYVRVDVYFRVQMCVCVHMFQVCRGASLCMYSISVLMCVCACVCVCVRVLPAAGLFQQHPPSLPEAVKVVLDLVLVRGVGRGGDALAFCLDHLHGATTIIQQPLEIGRASCRERV